MNRVVGSATIIPRSGWPSDRLAMFWVQALRPSGDHPNFRVVHDY